jgi:hypothetical protein
VIVIRNKQMEVLDREAVASYLLSHVRRFARDHAESVGEENLRKLVQLAIQRAASFGWTKRGPLEFFLEVMVMLGSDFHTDPQYPWAAASLNASLDEMAGADNLHAEVMKYYDAVLGPGLCCEVEAIQRLLASDYARDRQLSPAGKSEILRALKWAYPEKYTFVGEQALGALIGEAEDVCAHFGFADTGLALVTATLFSFGHTCFSDPQYPWILASTQVQAATKEAALRRVFKRYMEEALTNMERG